MTESKLPPRKEPGRESPWELAVGPAPEHWDNWVELDPQAWPERKERHYRCVPTICFNCESACGLLAFMDKETGEVRLMKVQAGTPMTEVIKQYAALSGIDEAECRFLVGGKPLKTDKPLDEQVALTATQPPPSAIVDDGDEGDCSCSCMPSMG